MRRRSSSAFEQSRCGGSWVIAIAAIVIAIVIAITIAITIAAIVLLWGSWLRGLAASPSRPTRTPRSPPLPFHLRRALGRRRVGRASTLRNGGSRASRPEPPRTRPTRTPRGRPLRDSTRRLRRQTGRLDSAVPPSPVPAAPPSPRREGRGDVCVAIGGGGVYANDRTSVRALSDWSTQGNVYILLSDY